MPIAVSPASYIPGVKLARGSVASEPVIPAGSGGAGSGVDGFAPLFWFAGLVSGAVVGGGGDEGEGEGVCARVSVAKHEPKTIRATSKQKIVRTRFIVSPKKLNFRISPYL